MTDQQFLDAQKLVSSMADATNLLTSFFSFPTAPETWGIEENAYFGQNTIPLVPKWKDVRIGQLITDNTQDFYNTLRSGILGLKTIVEGELEDAITAEDQEAADTASATIGHLNLVLNRMPFESAPEDWGIYEHTYMLQRFITQKAKWTDERIDELMVMNCGEIYDATRTELITLNETFATEFQTNLPYALVVAQPSTMPDSNSGTTIYLTSTAGTYTNFPDSGASPIVISSNQVAFIVKSGSFYVKMLLPMPTSDIAPLSGYTDLKNFVDGATLTAGLTGLDNSYTSAISSSSTRLLDIGTSRSGKLTQVQYWGSRAGVVQWKLFKKNLDGTYSVKNDGADTWSHTAVVGLNTMIAGGGALPAGLMMDPTDRLAFYSSSGTGSVGFKAGSNTPVSAVSGNVSTNVAFGVAGSTNDYAINFTYAVSSVTDKLTAVMALAQKYGADTALLYESDISYEGAADAAHNIFSTGTIVENALVKNDGTIGSGAGWKYIRIPLAKGRKQIFVDKVDIRPLSNPAAYARFLNAAGAAVGDLIEFESGEPFNEDIPEGATTICIDIQDPSTTASAYVNAVVSYLGEKVSAIQGTPLLGDGGGGEAYDQDLNKGDEVEFASVKTNVLIIDDDLPVSTDPEVVPVGVAAGDEYWLQPTGSAFRYKVVAV